VNLDVGECDPVLRGSGVYPGNRSCKVKRDAPLVVQVCPDDTANIACRTDMLANRHCFVVTALIFALAGCIWRWLSGLIGTANTVRRTV
jgi:hypothetical protein